MQTIVFFLACFEFCALAYFLPFWDRTGQVWSHFSFNGVARLSKRGYCRHKLSLMKPAQSGVRGGGALQGKHPHLVACRTSSMNNFDRQSTGFAIALFVLGVKQKSGD